MVVCIVFYVVLLLMFVVDKKTDLFHKIRKEEKKKIFLVLLVSNILATCLFSIEILQINQTGKLTRNTYGEGSRFESYEVTVDGELEEEPIKIEVQERQYTQSEIQDIFEQMKRKIDKIILGENESRDRVEKDLKLVNSLEGYPVDIRWELDNYKVLTPEGEINQEETKEEGTLVSVRGILSYGTEETIYVTQVMVYPETKTGRAKWIDAIKESVTKQEESTREEEGFSLPDTVLGKDITWKKQKDARGYYLLALGILLCGILVWKGRQDKKEERKKKDEQMIRDYPDIISKFTLLLSTGMTVKAVWNKIVETYEEKQLMHEQRHAYEEMRITCREMQSGVSEAEAYERFGRRCQVVLYVKFGALLSQNLKKGGKGLSELLKLESVQAFENRKSMARRKGEEAATKLLIPMFGMLAVVMVMIIIPAFLSIQL